MQRLLVILFSVAIGLSTIQAQVSRNVSLFGRLAPNPFRYSGCWFYADSAGHEYGLLGGYNGTHVIAIDDSANIHEVGFVSGPQSNWRELTVVGNHAFVVTEGGGSSAGMQVISLSSLPDSVHLVTTYRTTFTTGHIIMRDVFSDSAYVYVSGSTTTGGVHILNVANPAVPVQVGVYRPAYYIHDAHIRGNRLYASSGSAHSVDIVDLTNKQSPALLTRIQYPGYYTHSCSTTGDQRFLFITDEQDGQLARIWNIESLGNTFQVAQYSANTQTLVHNPYIRGNYAFISHNAEGLRVVDIADATVPVEVGYYDTYLPPGGGSNGLWSACPYLPSGRIIGGDRTGGLYVWKFNNARAGRIYGKVQDSLSGAGIDSAQVMIVETGRMVRSKINGEFKIGELPGSYALRVSAPGYSTRTIGNVSLNGGDSLSFIVGLKRITSNVEGATPGIFGFALDQNYPNPFNPTTNIKYSLPFAGHVSLKVYDVVGREVATLVNEEIQPGSHVVTFSAKSGSASDEDAKNLSSGAYFYTLHWRNFSQTKKLQILK